jgi:paraquat-inducible protein B
MSKRANPTLIGSFVIGAIALAVVTILVLSRGSLFAIHPDFVMYFDGSVKGLAVGAPVTFNGVQIGIVKDISIAVEPDTKQFLVPVIVELEPERLTLTHGTLEEARKKVNVPALINVGLRAQLQTESLLTGQLYIQLDFYPDKPARFVSENKKLPEIPTIPTPVQQLTKKFQDFPIDKVLNDIARTTDALERMMNSPQIPQTVQNINKALVNLNESLTNLDKSVVSVRNTFGEKSPIAYQLNDTLQEITKAARSVRVLADTIDRQPESLLKGKRSDNK